MLTTACQGGIHDVVLCPFSVSALSHFLSSCNVFCVFRNTSVEEYYSYYNESGTGGYYYMNSFENILVSGGNYFKHFATVLSCDV